MSMAVSGCEIRAAKYMAESVATNTGRWAILTPDVNIANKQDLSFVSFGLLSNVKTADVLNSTGNSLVLYREGCFVSRLSGKTVIAPSPTMDYGLIAKVCHSDLAGRTWICCGGFGEWGTSGAAWYLARNWKQIRRRFGPKPFAMIVRVVPERDESAEAVVWADAPEELESYTRP